MDVERAALLAGLAREQRDEERRRADRSRPPKAPAAARQSAAATATTDAAFAPPPRRFGRSVERLGAALRGRRSDLLSSRIAERSTPAVGVFTVVLDAGSRPAPVQDATGVHSADVDHVCFSIDPLLTPAGWIHRAVPYFGVDAAQTSLYVATHAGGLLPEYDVTVWLAPSLIGGRPTVPIVEAVMPTSDRILVAAAESTDTSTPAALARLADEWEGGTTALHERFVEVLRDLESVRSWSADFVVRSNRSPQIRDLDRIWWAASQLTGASPDACFSLASAISDVAPQTLPVACVAASDRIRSQRPVKLERPSRGPFDRVAELDRIRGAVARATDEVVRGEPSDGRWAVVVPVHDAPEYTERCLSSVVSTIPDWVDLIIVDDGSAPETAEICERFSSRYGATLLRSDAGSGFGRAANRGLDAASAHGHVVVLNSDTEVPAGWVQTLRRHFEAAPTVGAIGPLSNDARHQSVPFASNSVVDWSHHERNERPPPVDLLAVNRFLVARDPQPAITRVPMINGFCMALSRDALQQVGGFDTDAFPEGYGEEVDWCYRAVDAGVELAIALDLYVHHAKSRSYSPARAAVLRPQATDTLGQRWGLRSKRSLRSLARNESLRAVRADVELLYTCVGDVTSH